MDLVLHNQHGLSYMKSIAGSLSINTPQSITPFCLSFLHSFLTYLVNLPSMISHVYLHLRMHPFFIIYRICQILVHHLTIERINYSLKVHLTFNLHFLKTHRVNFSSSHLPLCLIHRFMRMSMKTLIFMILAIVIYLPPYSITMMILS